MAWKGHYSLEDLDMDGGQFWHNASVLVKESQNIDAKKELVQKGFLECVPHQVRGYTYVLMQHFFDL